MPRLSVFLLGPPRVELAGSAIDLSRRKAMALVAYLLVTHQPHSREALAALLWPEADQSRAFAYLRTTLWTLNAALGDEWIAAERDAVEIRAGGDLWVDVWQFRALVAGAAAGDPSGSCAALSQATDLYGNDFLAGFTLADCPAFDEWQFFERESLRRQFSGVLDDLVHCHSATGQFENAIPYAQRRLSLDTLHEPAHRQLMQLYAWTGQWSAALRQFRQCASILEDELGVEPEPETQALYEAIQERRSPEPPGAIVPVPQPAAQAATAPPVPTSHIPVQSTPLVARERELAEIAQMLEDPACRLLTLVGQGGIGKTRLALQVATEIAGRYTDGVYFVSLAPVNSTRYLVPTLADALRFTPFREGDLKSQLLSYLREKHLLLVMDNFEHLLDGVDLVAEILSGAPKVRIFATSRERLQLQGEWLYETHGLTYPDDGIAHAASGDELLGYGAVQLFLHCARHIQPDFTLSEANRAAVIRICQLVEGMPLGLELAAAWLPILAPEDIVQEIERSLDFLTVSLRDLPARHRSLRAVFESSWERLTPAEQRILGRLSMFRAAFRREAAEAVAGASLQELLALTNKSLLHRSAANRYSLHELLRQFAEEKLNADPEERDRTRDLYVTYYADFLRSREAGLKGERQIETLDDIEAEIDNIRAAWILAVWRRNGEAIRGLLVGLSLFSLMRSRLRESGEMFGNTVHYLETLSLTSDEQILLAEIKVMEGMAFRELGKMAEAHDLYRDALPVLRSLEDPATAFFLLMLGMLSLWPAFDNEEAEALARKALPMFEAEGDRWGVAHALHTLGEVVHHTIHYDQSKPLFLQSLDICRAIGDHWGESHSLDMLGQVAYTHGEYPEAEDLYRQALALHEAIGNPNQISWCLRTLADLLAIQGRYAEARETAFQGLKIARTTGDPHQVAYTYAALAKIATGERRYAEAFEFSQHSLEAFKSTDSREGRAWVQIDLCPIALDLEDVDELERRARESLSVFENTQSPWGRSAALYYLGEAARLKGDLATARDLLVQSIRLADGASSVMLVVRHLVGFAAWLAQTGEPQWAVELLALVAHHPATWQVTRDRAHRLLAEVAATLPPEIALPAQESGAKLSVDAVVADILSHYYWL